MLSIIFVVVGLYLLVFGADKFILGASQLATYLKMSPLVVGIVIVGFGTSAPEIAVSIMASLEGKGGLSVGNAYGSNIANIALILGIVLIMTPVKVTDSIRKKELPLLLAVSFLSLFLLLDFEIARLDGFIFLICFIAIFSHTLFNSKDINLNEDKVDVVVSKRQWCATMFKLFFGLFLLVASSKILVIGASDLALKLGISEFIIGLSVVAIGTSLPELATSIVAVRKKEHDMALGNIIGSNMFNTLAVISISTIIHPVSLNATIIHRDISLMLALTILLFVFSLFKKGLNRLHGIIFLGIYIVYMFFIGYTSTLSL